MSLVVSPWCVYFDVSDATCPVSRLRDSDRRRCAGLRHPSHTQSSSVRVLIAAARSIAGLCRSAHITATLVSLHWLRAPKRVQSKLAVLLYRALHGTAPRYLSNLLRRVADMSSRSRLRSSSTSRLDVRPSCRVEDRSFVVTGPSIWNSLPGHITSASSLSVFRRQLKTHLFVI